jgi:outer membrane protein TolC
MGSDKIGSGTMGSDRIRLRGWDVIRIALTFTFVLRGTLTAQDSARVSVLEHEIELARIRLEATSLWRRIIPSIHLSASFGMNNALVYDPSSTLLLPRDSYRLTISFPLHELFRTEQHDEAEVRLRRLDDELRTARKECAIAQERTRDQADRAANELRVLNAELHLLREIVRYNEVLFSEGKVRFDVLTRARLQVLQAERQILHLQSGTERTN